MNFSHIPKFGILGCDTSAGDIGAKVRAGGADASLGGDDDADEGGVDATGAGRERC
jgi:hypothetical protein